MGEQMTSLPTGAYVVHAGPEGPGLTFDELKAAMNRAIERATAGRPGGFRAHGHVRSSVSR
jgi:hypothetical protein